MRGRGFVGHCEVNIMIAFLVISVVCTRMGFNSLLSDKGLVLCEALPIFGGNIMMHLYYSVSTFCEIRSLHFIKKNSCRNILLNLNESDYVLILSACSRMGKFIQLH